MKECVVIFKGKAREDEKYRLAEEKTAREEEYWDRVRMQGNRAQKNVSAVAYDITNLEYHQTVDGEEQKYADDMGK